MVAECEKSLKLLRTDYIDLYQIHWPKNVVPIDETLGAMQGLVDQGKVRALGVCNFGVQDLTDALGTDKTLVSNQIAYSMLGRAVEFEVAELCAERGVRTVPGRVFDTFGRPSRGVRLSLSRTDEAQIEQGAAVLADDVELTAADLEGAGTPGAAGRSAEGATDWFGYARLEDFRAATEKEFLRRKLLEFGGNIKRTAENIQLQRSNLYKKLDRYGLK